MNENLTYLKFEAIDESFRYPNLVKVRERLSKYLEPGLFLSWILSLFGASASGYRYAELEASDKEEKIFLKKLLRFTGVSSIIIFVLVSILMDVVEPLKKILLDKTENMIIKKVKSIPEGQELIDSVIHLKKYAKKIQPELKSDFEKIVEFKNLRNINFQIYCDYLVVQSYEQLNLLNYPEYRDKISDTDFQTVQQEELYIARSVTSPMLLKRIQNQRKKIEKDVKKFYNAYQKLYDQGLV